MIALEMECDTTLTIKRANKRDAAGVVSLKWRRRVLSRASLDLLLSLLKSRGHAT